MSRLPVRAGFFGKLPSRGDFVRAHLSRVVTASWDQWLQSVLPAAQARLGDRWTEAWRPAHGWRFALGPGVCGPQPVTGVWLPSADKVGRSFPLMIAVEAAVTDDAFLETAERLGADAIGGTMAPDMLARRLGLAPPPLLAALAAGAVSGPAGGGPAACWWRRAGRAGGEVLRGTALPDADTFMRMLAA